MFKKRRTFRRNFRRGPPLARVRRTWVESVIVDPCNPLSIPVCLPDDGCCTTRWEQVVLDNQVLQDKFSDRASVVRILGNLQIGLFVGAPTDSDDFYARMSAAFASLYVQLLVRPVNAAGVAELPPDIWDTTSLISGFSESKAKKSWWHHWWSNDQFRMQAGAFKAGSDITLPVWKPAFWDCLTHNTAYLWGKSAAGTGAVGASLTCVPGTDVPVDGLELGGECDACGPVTGLESLLSNNGEVGYPRTWNFQFDVKKRIRLREDEQLILDFQARVPQTQYDDWTFVVNGGGIKTLIQF